MIMVVIVVVVARLETAFLLHKLFRNSFAPHSYYTNLSRTHQKLILTTQTYLAAPLARDCILTTQTFSLRATLRATLHATLRATFGLATGVHMRAQARGENGSTQDQNGCPKAFRS